MPSDPKNDPTPEQIEKMLEEARMKAVPSHILKGFKEDVMRRIESQPRIQSGRWRGSGLKLPRVGLSVGFGALACLIVVSLAVLTTDRPGVVSDERVAAVLNGSEPAVSSVRTDPGVFQVASLPAAALPAAAPIRQESAKMMSAPSVGGSRSAAPRSATKSPAQLTVEEELRLIEEFDDQEFFIRQDITEDDIASA